MVESLDRRAVEGGLERAGIPAQDPEADRRMSHLARGWYWGSQSFAERLLSAGEAVLGKQRHRSGRTGGESRGPDEARALGLLREGLAADGLEPEQPAVLKGSDARKVAIASVLWENTTMSLG